MAHTLTIQNDSVSISLAVASGTGIYLSQFVPPSSDRKATRVGPAAPIYGQRTIVSTMADQDVKITCVIVGTSADNVEAQLLALIRLLDLAREWEEARTGSPVRLAWKRAGATNAAYWTITGVPQLPQPVGAEGWLDEENATNQLTIDMVLTLEPIAHAAAPNTIKSATAITTTVGSDTITTIATAGDLPGPADVWVTRTSTGNDWNTVWIAQIPQAPDFTDYSGTVDAAAFGGQGQTATYTSPTLLSFTGSGYTIDTAKQYPIRGFIRMKVTTAPTAGITAVQVRMRVNFGTSTGNQWTGAWVPFAGTLNQYTLLDMGAVPVMTNLQNRGASLTASYFVTVEMQSTDATTFTVRADYSTFVAYAGLVKVTGVSLANTDVLVYESNYSNATYDYYTPRQDVQTYEMNSTNVLQTNATRVGRLSRLPGGATAMYWVEGQSTGLHQITDTATVFVQQLPCYQAGLRGIG